jgi:hypothetical protein
MSWEERGIAEQSVAVDASELAEVAAEAEWLWEPPEGHVGWSGGLSTHGMIRVTQKKGAGGRKGKAKKKKD